MSKLDFYLANQSVAIGSGQITLQTMCQRHGWMNDNLAQISDALKNINSQE